MLNKINFPWESPRSGSQKWESYYQKLIQFLKNNDETWPDANSAKPREKELARWCTTQRYKRENKALKREHVQKLNAIGFQWKREGHPRQSAFERAWNHHLESLLAFRKKHGRDPLTGVRNVKEAKLVLVCCSKEEEKKERSLGRQKVEILNNIGFAWKLKTGPKRREA